MSEKQLRRWHRLKWVGLAACLALVVVLLVEGIQVNTKNTALWVFNSCVIVFHQPIGPGIEAGVWDNWKIQFGNHVGLMPQHRSITLKTGRLISLSVSLRPFLLLAVIVTAVLWRLDRRFPAGHCQECGYDLTGNVSGVCSECGTEVQSRRSATRR